MNPLFEKRPVLILFSGGDSPGMNPFMRAATRLGGNLHDVPVIGVMDGYAGLVRTLARLESGEVTLDSLRKEILRRPGIFGFQAKKQHLVHLDPESVSGLVVRGGIKLRSARCDEFRDDGIRARVIQMLLDLGFRAVIVCGGDGSLAGARRLHEESGIQVVGVPGTIDNDLPVTDWALGVQSAIENILEEVTKIKDTARSHRRVMVLETMGRDCGELALLSAIASGAEYAIIPEDGFLSGDRIRKLAGEIEQSHARGRTHSIVLVAEGVRMDKHKWESPAWMVAMRLGECFKHGPFKEIETRATVLGYVQRGGSPAAFDSILAAEFAGTAWQAIMGTGASGVTVVRNGGHKLVSFDWQPDPLERAARLQKLRETHHALSGY